MGTPSTPLYMVISNIFWSSDEQLEWFQDITPRVELPRGFRHRQGGCARIIGGHCSTGILFAQDKMQSIQVIGTADLTLTIISLNTPECSIDN